MINLLTVVCSQDLALLPLHIESVEKFVSHPVRHWIVLNEEDDFTDAINSIVEQHRAKNHYIVLHRNVFYDRYRQVFVNKSGWESQQVIKLAAARIIREHYFSIDCKVFFCKEIDLENLNIIGSGLYLPRSEETHWDLVDRYYAEYFGLALTDPIMKNQTLFKILHQPLIEFEKRTPLDQALFPPKTLTAANPDLVFPAEHLFYYNLLRYKKYDFSAYSDPGHILEPITNFSTSYFYELKKKQTTCAYVHWKILGSLTKEDRKNLNSFLGSIGLRYKFKNR
jgi:hypothetical protein